MKRRRIRVNVSPKSRLTVFSRVAINVADTTHLVIDFREYRSQLFAGLSSSNSHSLVADLYKLSLGDYLCVLATSRGISGISARVRSRTSRPDIAPISLRYCRLYVEREGPRGSLVSSLFSRCSSLLINL